MTAMDKQELVAAAQAFTAAVENNDLDTAAEELEALDDLFDSCADEDECDEDGDGEDDGEDAEEV